MNNNKIKTALIILYSVLTCVFVEILIYGLCCVAADDSMLMPMLWHAGAIGVVLIASLIQHLLHSRAKKKGYCTYPIIQSIFSVLKIIAYHLINWWCAQMLLHHFFISGAPAKHYFYGINVFVVIILLIATVITDIIFFKKNNRD